MTPRYLNRATNQRDRWLVSYVDVLTILLIFFLVAAARSLELPPVTHPVTPAPPSVARTEAEPARTNPMRANLTRVQERLRELGMESTLDPRGLVISLPQVILFASGEDVVSPKALPTLAQIADALRDIPNDVRLIGHADTVPIHNRRFDSNWDLSMARSHKILELLTSRYGIPESRLSVTSYGPYRPVAPNETADGRASNRRVEILIMDESHGEGARSE